jgi:Protein of unknown function (DUF1566)
MVNNLMLVGCALAVSLAFVACNSSSDNSGSDAIGAAGSGADAGSNAEAGSSTEAGSTGVGDTELAEWPMPNAPGTGLTKIESYDATSTAGVVHDNVTGLDWLQDPGTALFSRADAITHCDTLSLAGFDDWRAPTYIELVSLFDAVPDDSDPSEPIYISPVFSIGARYWATTPPTGTNTSLGRLVDFSANDCNADADAACSIGVAGDKTKALGGAFCVRSSAPPPATPRFEVDGNNVTDTFTGLGWTTLPDAIQTGSYDDAVTRCDAIGARLPSITELLSILAPALDVKAFPGWDAMLFAWSSSPIPVKAGSYWAAADGGATSPFAASTGMARIECVH